MKDGQEEVTKFVDALPEKALLPYFTALLTISQESVVVTFAKKVTVFMQNLLSWFVMGTMITGLIWVISYLLNQIKTILM